ncbi:hypothetical protein CALVIDRAFT_304740 [Calocera viscosa TUFC12733]|uniref:Uncharacterized protein n=1 Tax=Calocera viscosa (strain TUFC12733) TaxID=1330018 RepID=A0A167IGA5_CALVF|nr:hypothetical protein CALVIDRAFT_304740 [Calocera viscosa TUFC12733]
MRAHGTGHERAGRDRGMQNSRQGRREVPRQSTRQITNRERRGQGGQAGKPAHRVGRQREKGSGRAPARKPRLAGAYIHGSGITP